MRVLLIIGLVLVAVGIALFGAISGGLLPPVWSPVSMPFLIGFMALLGGALTCAFYLSLKLWQRLYKRPSQPHR